MLCGLRSKTPPAPPPTSQKGVRRAGEAGVLVKPGLLQTRLSGTLGPDSQMAPEPLRRSSLDCPCGSPGASRGVSPRAPAEYLLMGRT